MFKIKYIFLSISLLVLVGCTDEFQDINTNPNAPVDVQPSLLLRQVQWDYGEKMSYEGFVAGNLLGQYFTAIDFNLFDRHSLSEPQFGGNPWDILYINLRDNEIILNKSLESQAFAVYEGPARVMKAYMSSVLTDLFGDVPYFQALQGKDDIITPVYDSQEDIYLAADGIIDQLDQAIEAIRNYNGSIGVEGDIIYNGDLDNWLRFANSLKVKCLMRVADRVDVSSDLQELYDENMLIDSPSYNAVFDFSSTQPNNFRMSTARVGDYNLYIMSETIQEVLEDLDDPRKEVLFRPTGNDNTVYQGFLNGPDASQLSISVSDYSLTGTIFRENAGDLDANFLTSFEVHFLLAEAAERGLISVNAQFHYALGVLHAFDYWHTVMPANYLSTGAAAYGENGADKIAQIITQKWLANIGNGYEGWIDYRRTGFPALKTIAASLNGDLIPVRMPYPATEAALNTTNYNQAAAATQGNSINARVWWDSE